MHSNSLTHTNTQPNKEDFAYTLKEIEEELERAAKWLGVATRVYPGHEI